MVCSCYEGSVAAPRCHLFEVVAGFGKALDLRPANTHLGKQRPPGTSVNLLATKVTAVLVPWAHAPTLPRAATAAVPGHRCA